MEVDCDDVFAAFGSSYKKHTHTKKAHLSVSLLVTAYGAGTRSRTRDLLITSQLLYQLSYTGVMGAEYIDIFVAVNLSSLISFKNLLNSFGCRVPLTG